MSRKIEMTRFALIWHPLYGRICLFFLLTIGCSMGYVELRAEGYGEEERQVPSQEDEQFHAPDFSSLNIRLGTKPISPPAHMVKRMLLLENLQRGSPIPEGGVRSAIIEDDAGRQVLILSVQATQEAKAPIQAYLLYDFDLESRLPTLKHYTQERRCAQGARDQQAGTGGLACIAICMVQALHPPTS